MRKVFTWLRTINPARLLLVFLAQSWQYTTCFLLSVTNRILKTSTYEAKEKHEFVSRLQCFSTGSYKQIQRNKERCFSSCHERGTKKIFWVPIRNRTSDLRIPRSDAPPLSHRDSTVSEVYYEVHMTRVLHTARISNVDSVMFVEHARSREHVLRGQKGLKRKPKKTAKAKWKLEFGLKTHRANHTTCNEL